MVTVFSIGTLLGCWHPTNKTVMASRQRFILIANAASTKITIKSSYMELSLGRRKHFVNKVVHLVEVAIKASHALKLVAQIKLDLLR